MGKQAQRQRQKPLKLHFDALDHSVKSLKINVAQKEENVKYGAAELKLR